MPLLKLSQMLHDTVFEPLLILSYFESKAQYYFPNLNVSGKNWAGEQFCHQLDFFYLQTAKKLQLIDSAACRTLRFKLAETNLIDLNRDLYYEGEDIRFTRFIHSFIPAIS